MAESPFPGLNRHMERKTKRRLGLLNTQDIKRVTYYDPAMAPASLPDPEDLARDARRRLIARRRGRMSTILTGGSLGSPDAALGG